MTIFVEILYNNISEKTVEWTHVGCFKEAIEDFKANHSFMMNNSKYSFKFNEEI